MTTPPPLAARLVASAGLLVIGVLVPALEINATHLFNPDWPAHARLHEGWQLATNSALAAAGLWLAWARGRVAAACGLGLLASGGFLVAWALRDLYGGSMAGTRTAAATLAGVDVAAWVMLAVTLALAGTAWWQRPRAAAHLAHVALLVRDYDEAIAWFTRVLGFRVVEDRPVPEQGKRWVLVAPPGGGTSLLLARAATAEQARFVGDQAGGRVFLFLETDDIARDEARLRAQGATIVREPMDAPYGRVLVFADLHGNRWDLIQRR